MVSKLLDPTSNDTKPVFLRTVYDDVTKLPELDHRKYRVRRIRLFKEKTCVGHEFLILDVFDGTTDVRLLVERRPSYRKAEKPQPPWWNPLRLDLLVSDGDDVVKKAPDSEFSPAHYYLLTTLSANVAEAPTFAAVCQILWEVQRDAPNYTLFRRQCYWFTGTAIEILKRKYAEPLGEGEFRMQVKDDPEATRRGKTGYFSIYPEHKARQHVADQIQREEHAQEENAEMLRQQMQAAVNSAMIMAQEEHRESEEAMRTALQPFLTTPEAYQRAFWANAMADVEEECQKSKEDLQRVVQSLLVAEPPKHHADAQYWQSVFRNMTT